MARPSRLWIAVVLLVLTAGAGAWLLGFLPIRPPSSDSRRPVVENVIIPKLRAAGVVGEVLDAAESMGLDLAAQISGNLQFGQQRLQSAA